MARNAKLSELDRESIIRHYQDGVKKVSEIASIFNIDKSRIYQILKEKNIKRNRYV